MSTKSETARFADYLTKNWGDKITEGSAVDVAIKLLEGFREERAATTPESHAAEVPLYDDRLGLVAEAYETPPVPF